ncbi:MAG: MMPL family transporter [Firmicutes bacterium]|nr:MMPL family transporter [Bacillota bacterium]
MLKLGSKITKYRKAILVIAFLLLIPSVMGIMSVRINYDVLKYLPTSIETVKGEEILLNDFGKGAFSMVMVEGMDDKDVAELKSKIEKVDHVDTVLWYDSLLDVSIPLDMLPDKYYEAFNEGDATLMAVFFDTSVSADESLEAIEKIRDIGDKQAFVSGMSAFVTDLKNIAEEEEPIYVLIAVILACIVLALFMDSWLIPVIFIAGIGMEILYNLGSNVMFGEISYITKALSAVLQLGVTMDYSIFLWHSYQEQRKHFGRDREEAMSHAIANTITSVTGSSVTTIAGFLALCFMTFTLGLDLGLVMAKGVLLGVLGSVTLLPAMILTFEKPILRTRHRSLMPKLGRVSSVVSKKPGIFAVIFVVLLIPAAWGYFHTDVYYNLDKSVPQTLPFAVANEKLADEFNISTTHMALVDTDMEASDVKALCADMEKVDGVKYSLGYAKLLGPAVPEEMLPDNGLEAIKGDKYQLLVIGSDYKVATDEENRQVDQLTKVIKKYDKNGMLIGEAACTRDLISITDRDFRIVSLVSILSIFLIIAFVLRSVSLPFILVAVIELAIFINMGIPAFTGTELPFIASICISTIQLGATVDYAILMTTRYKAERIMGKEKHEAVKIAHMRSMPSIIVSALGFFAATFGVGLYSDIDIISSLCGLMARGAIISMLAVIFILPSMFLLFDRIIIKTTSGMRGIKDTGVKPVAEAAAEGSRK